MHFCFGQLIGEEFPNILKYIDFSFKYFYKSRHRSSKSKHRRILWILWNLLDEQMKNRQQKMKKDVMGDVEEDKENPTTTAGTTPMTAAAAKKVVENESERRRNTSLADTIVGLDAQFRFVLMRKKTRGNSLAKIVK